LRVAFDGRTIGDHFPGIGRYAFNLARALVERPNPPELTLLNDPRQRNTRFDLESLAGAKIAAAPSVFSPAAQWRIPPQLRRSGVDLYHSPYYLMPYWSGVPAVVTFHDLIPMRYPAYYTAWARLIFSITMRLAVRTAARIIAISQATARDVCRTFGLDPTRISVIPEAPDPHFRPQPKDAQTLVLQRLGLPERYLLYFGSNKPHKNLPRLVEAFLGQNADIALIIAGHWDPRYPQARAAVEKAEASDRVRFMGAIAEADLPTVYGEAEAFVFPSEYEGFGLPPLEAMACGVPVACSNASSLPEVVGEAALLFNPLDVNDIRDKLNRLGSEPMLRDDLREKGLAQARKFSWAEAAERTLSVYESVRNQS
jgi:glycosyltransferase involved in cell wall biosynthesis